MPLAEYEDLFEVLKKRRLPFTEAEGRWLFSQLFSGAQFLHQRGIAFRDYSLENVLLFVDPVEKVIIPKITDPGQAVPFPIYDTSNNARGRSAKSNSILGSIDGNNLTAGTNVRRERERESSCRPCLYPPSSS